MRRTDRRTLAVIVTSLGLTATLVAGLWQPSAASAQNAATATPTATASQTFTPRPTAGATRTPTLTPGPGQYIVQPGDYLARIAVQYGVSVRQLKDANHLESDVIYPGQVLAIPPRVTSANPTRTTTALPPNARTYIVQAGDQLIKIARAFSIPLYQLFQANGLVSENIQVGQVLFIPTAEVTYKTETALPPGARTYVVKEGDQLLRIARTYGIPVDQLMQANGLTTDKLRPGQVLYIPAPVPTATKAPPTAVPAGWVTYKVQSGDRIQRIAIWYGVTWADIIAANGLDGYGTVRVGQMLAIPNPPRKPVVYTVQEGDTLQGLSERFQISVDFIRIANYNFKGDTIYAGLTLIIPMRPEMIP